MKLKMGDLISIGKIIGTHGYRGLVKVLPLTDFPERFEKMAAVKLRKNNRLTEMLIESVKPYKSFYLFKFRHVETKENAQEYKNALLQIEENELYPLPENCFYHFQLQGLRVYDVETGFLGELKEILETGANDVYLVDSQQFGEILIPAIKDVIVKVDLVNKEMRIRLLAGLIENEE